MSMGQGDESGREPSAAPTSLPATSPFGITVPVQVIPDRDLGISRPGAHAAGAPLTHGVTIDTDTGATVMWAPPPPRKPATPGTLLRIGALWAGLLGLLLLAATAGVGALNQQLYSPSGFVQQYLGALAAGDAEAALSFPGVEPQATELAAAGLPTTLPRTLLRDTVLRAPQDVRVIGDERGKNGVHRVSVEYTLAGQKAQSVFEVERTGTNFGVFNDWRFASSPLAVLTVTVLHDAEFSVNGLTLDTRAHHDADAEPTFSNSASYLAFSPSTYELSKDSRLLAAAPVTLPVTTSDVTEATVDVQPTADFVNDVQEELNKWLDESCATQTVLQPTGCPFGVNIDDRVISGPTWSITEYPAVTLTPGENAFEMPQTPAVAHVQVEVQSLFDGDVEMLDQDEPFSMALSVTITPSGSLDIKLH
ncbi:hypothetical protein [Microterricola pindariensis]|uniref:hypothetical protein n=1 Tax=Microterricola pindariensis TaxID=478010 RepID=UPI000CEBB09E|nr:hypothetical protein [Microterricola pindariensis]